LGNFFVGLRDIKFRGRMCFRVKRLKYNHNPI
jgi:hypothetical protein